MQWSNWKQDGMDFFFSNQTWAYLFLIHPSLLCTLLGVPPCKGALEFPQQKIRCYFQRKRNCSLIFTNTQINLKCWIQGASAVVGETLESKVRGFTCKLWCQVFCFATPMHWMCWSEKDPHRVFWEMSLKKLKEQLVTDKAQGSVFMFGKPIAILKEGPRGKNRLVMPIDV